MGWASHASLALEAKSKSRRGLVPPKVWDRGNNVSLDL